MTKSPRRADGDAASSKKCTHKPSAVNAKPVAAADNHLAGPMADLRLRRAVEKIHSLNSARVWLELLLELGRRCGIHADVAITAEKFASLTPALLHATGGDRLPPVPLHLVPAGRE